jgi:hypothetical protein
MFRSAFLSINPANLYGALVTQVFISKNCPIKKSRSIEEKILAPEFLKRRQRLLPIKAPKPLSTLVN